MKINIALLLPERTLKDALQMDIAGIVITIIIIIMKHHKKKDIQFVNTLYKQAIVDVVL